MNKPWPDDVLDCAKRLAKSLGYEDSQIRAVKGQVEVYRHADSIPFSAGYDNWYWFELDPRDPTVWSALVGKDKVLKLVYYYKNQYHDERFVASLDHDGIFYALSNHPGLAVCEVYNALKSNSRLEVSV
jgi:hypothetical protein